MAEAKVWEPKHPPISCEEFKAGKQEHAFEVRHPEGLFEKT